MSKYRSYFTDDNVIINKSRLNTGINEIVELVYGNVTTNFNSVSTGDTIFSRYIFKIDLQKIKNKYINEQIDISLFKTHKIHIQNTIHLKEDLGGKTIIDGSKRAFDVTLKLYKIPQDWIEGYGYDYIYNNTLVSKINDTSINPSNWFSANNTTNWTNEGVLPHNPTLIDSQYFKYGIENIEFDITNDVNNYLTGNTENYGYLIAFDSFFETKQESNLYKIQFFSRHTNTYFEPYLESVIEDTIFDSNRTLQDNTNLYIQTNKTVNKVEIYDDCDELILTLNNVVKLNKTTYKVFLDVIGNDFVDNKMYYVKWLNNNTLVKETNLVFYEENQSQDSTNNLFNVKITGLKFGEKIKRGDKRKINANINRLFNNSSKLSKITFDLYVEQYSLKNTYVYQNELMNYFNGEYYFILDSEWLLEQVYFLKVNLHDEFDNIIDSNIVKFIVN